jgi:hypothetical protein
MYIDPSVGARFAQAFAQKFEVLPPPRNTSPRILADSSHDAHMTAAVMGIVEEQRKRILNI